MSQSKIFTIDDLNRLNAKIRADRQTVTQPVKVSLISRLIRSLRSV